MHATLLRECRRVVLWKTVSIVLRTSQDVKLMNRFKDPTSEDIKKFLTSSNTSVLVLRIANELLSNWMCNPRSCFATLQTTSISFIHVRCFLIYRNRTWWIATNIIQYNYLELHTADAGRTTVFNFCRPLTDRQLVDKKWMLTDRRIIQTSLRIRLSASTPCMPLCWWLSDRRIEYTSNVTVRRIRWNHLRVRLSAFQPTATTAHNFLPQQQQPLFFAASSTATHSRGSTLLVLALLLLFYPPHHIIIITRLS